MLRTRWLRTACSLLASVAVPGAAPRGVTLGVEGSAGEPAKPPARRPGGKKNVSRSTQYRQAAQSSREQVLSSVVRLAPRAGHATSPAICMPGRILPTRPACKPAALNNQPYR